MKPIVRFRRLLVCTVLMSGPVLAAGPALAQQPPEEPATVEDESRSSVAGLVQALVAQTDEDFVVWVHPDNRVVEIRLSSERQAELAGEILGPTLSDYQLVVGEDLGTRLPTETPSSVDDLTYWDKIDARDTFMRIMGSREFREEGLPPAYFIHVSDPDGAVTIRVQTGVQADAARRLFGDDVWLQVTDNPLGFEFRDGFGSGLTSLSRATVERSGPDWIDFSFGLGVVAASVLAVGFLWGRTIGPRTYLGAMLLSVGAIVVLLSLLADPMFGGEPGFGLTQFVGVVVGLDMSLAGGWLLRSPRSVRRGNGSGPTPAPQS